jgi:hypothetical protein
LYDFESFNINVRIERNALRVSALITVCDSLFSLSQFNPLISTYLTSLQGEAVPGTRVMYTVNTCNCEC